MASSKCSVDSCKRDSDTLCAHCQKNVCTKHYIEHAKSANDELIPLADKLNSIMNSIQERNPLHQVFEKLERWRERVIDISIRYATRKRQLQGEVQEKIEKQMSEFRQLSEQVKELVDEGYASFRQIEKIKRDIEECEQQCKQFGKGDNLRLHLKPIEIEVGVVSKELFSGGKLLSMEQQMKLNEFYGRNKQRWMLIYKATRDGFGSKDFHQHCDYQCATMAVIQSKNGGYLLVDTHPFSWRSIEEYVEDNNGSFIFTLTNPHDIPPTKYVIKDALHSICDYEINGPTFGHGHDIYVCDNSDTKLDSYFNFPGAYNDTTNQGSVTFTGSKSFRHVRLKSIDWCKTEKCIIDPLFC